MSLDFIPFLAQKGKLPAQSRTQLRQPPNIASVFLPSSGTNSRNETGNWAGRSGENSYPKTTGWRITGLSPTAMVHSPLQTTSWEMLLPVTVSSRNWPWPRAFHSLVQKLCIPERSFPANRYTLHRPFNEAQRENSRGAVGNCGTKMGKVGGIKWEPLNSFINSPREWLSGGREAGMSIMMNGRRFWCSKKEFENTFPDLGRNNNEMTRWLYAEHSTWYIASTQ